jgi:hypothetical protein
VGSHALALATVYRLCGRDAQYAFWGQGGEARLSMLHQLAQRCGG